MFYLPHGLTIDASGNRWMTDVAMHQVFKFEPNNKQPSLTLGKLFEPASGNEDTDRFCQPTDLAVTSTGDIYVADGYCASRVMKFDRNGRFIQQFGVEDAQIPHSLALIEQLDLVCVADREGMRVLCYNAGIKNISRLGEPVREYSGDKIGRVYAIAYSNVDGTLYGVTGPTNGLNALGFAIDVNDDNMNSDDMIDVWSPDYGEFIAPHDVAVSNDGQSVFVIEIREKDSPLWKFKKLIQSN